MDEEALLVIRRWIKKAEHDLTPASVVLDNKPEVTDTVCFHAQQCVEKALKAYLTLAGVHVEKTHHLPSICSTGARPFCLGLRRSASMREP
jgi:HEPN domain-containing protein